MEEKKTWPFWLTIALAAAAALFQGLSLLVQLQHEQAHDKTDYTPMVISILVTVAAWVITAIAVVRNWRDAHRADSLRSQILTVKDEQKTQLSGLENKLREQSEKASSNYKMYLEQVEELKALRIRERNAVTAVSQIRQTANVEPNSTIPPNAAELVWNWRRMVTKAHNTAREEKITFADALVRDASFPDLRPHLRKEVKGTIEGIQFGTTVQGILTAMDPLFNSVLEDIDRMAKGWGLPAEPHDRTSDKVIVTIRDGVITRMETTMVQIFLRVAVVNNRLPRTKLYEWHLDLRDQRITSPTFVSGTGSPIFRRLIHAPTLMQPPQPQPTKPDRVDKWLDTILRDNALPPAIGENGWLTFQFLEPSLCYAFGHTYRLSVRDEDGTTYYDEQSPGTWLEPVEVDWSGSGFREISVQGYGYSP